MSYSPGERVTSELLEAQAGTDAGVIADLAGEARATRVVQQGDDYVVLAHPKTVQVSELDLSRYVHVDQPKVSSGHIVVHDTASFLAALEQRRLEGRPLVAYADDERLALVAVLDDDVNDRPGHRRYRLQLSLRPTPQWQVWRQHDNKPFNQEDFAEFIQDNAPDFHEPSSASMLELATTIEATSSHAFKAGVRLSSGARQLLWNETVNAGAGEHGQLAIPDRIELTMQPFIGGPIVSVGAWFRYRIREGRLTLFYKLDRPDYIERAVFSQLVVEVATSESTAAPTIIRGPAP